MVVPIELPMVTQEEISHMAPTILIATHNMSKTIEYRTLT